MTNVVGMTEKTETGTARRAGLTPQRVIDAAQQLSKGAGLHSWTQRDLAAQLGVSPSVLYHHIGGRDQILRGVVERILQQMTLPDAGLDWQQWFRELLFDLRPIVMEYPGSAKWLLMHGPSFPGVVEVFDQGIGILSLAGFRRPAVVYALLLNSALLTVSMGDERLEQGEDGPRDHGAMLDEFSAVCEGSTGVTRMIDELIRPLADGGPAEAESANDLYYRLLVESLLAGVWQRRGTL